MAKLYVIGIGPGGEGLFTKKMIDAIHESEVIIGYGPYLDYLGSLIEGKTLYSTGMKSEIDRCKEAIQQVDEGKTTSIISTGDAGLYGMAGPIFELSTGQDIEVIPGVSANFAAAAELGAPIMHDYACISLSDLLTPWETILKRVRKAAEGDFVITIYNPRSKGRPDHLEKIVNILLEVKDSKTPVGIVKNAGRPGTERTITQLDSIDYEKVDMLTCLIIGNSNTYIKDGWMVTPRGYENK
ncbi:precorrin-3B C(17)-methyltransferase [Urinicoccus massiliensis]|uniref:precorrin-3B C(17)-methyltransferase n=1 Tax=Urinicoccus massiliensis TaxID=1723382 RepID=UPI0009315E96|nr:precorrin-3B C(17)-methyltransferase [Urinicoccus massiliensis]